jgi:hypothetical protein
MDVVVGTTEGLFRLTDAGITPVSSTGTTAIDGAWAIVERNAVVSLDSGVTVTTAPLTAQCVKSFGDGALVGTETARLFVFDGVETITPVESFDRIPTRDEWYTPWGAPPDTRSLTVTADGAALVNVHVGGVWRSEDDQWIEVVDVDNDTHSVVAALSGPRVAIAAAVGHGSSVDGGRTFTWTEHGLHGSYARAVAFAGDYVLLTASTGPFTKHGAIYRCPIDGDGPFEKCTSGLPEWFPYNIDTFQLSANNELAVFGTDDGDVFVSADEGSTWTLAAKDLPPVRCFAIR